MTNLKCSVKSCANNESNCCCRPDIKVDGKNACKCSETCCSDYVKQSVTDRMFSATNSTGYNTPSQYLSVACDAKNCVFNDAHRCSADTITVKNGSDGTECSSFVERH